MTPGWNVPERAPVRTLLERYPCSAAVIVRNCFAVSASIPAASNTAAAKLTEPVPGAVMIRLSMRAFGDVS